MAGRSGKRSPRLRGRHACRNQVTSRGVWSNAVGDLAPCPVTQLGPAQDGQIRAKAKLPGHYLTAAEPVAFGSTAPFRQPPRYQPLGCQRW